MKIVAIEVQCEGEKRYLVDAGLFAMERVTDDPARAKNYINNPEQMERDMSTLRVEGDEVYARSGLAVDALPQVVEFEVKATELSRRQGRELRKTAPTSARATAKM